MPRILPLTEILTLVSLVPRLHTLSIHETLVGVLEEHPPAVDTYPKHSCRLMLTNLHIDQFSFHTLITRLTAPGLSVFRVHIVRVKTFDIDLPFPQDVLSPIRSLDIGADEIYDAYYKYDPDDDKPLGPDDLRPKWPNLLSLAPADLKGFGADCDLRNRVQIYSLGEFLKTKGRHIEHLRLDFGGRTYVRKEVEGHDSGANPLVHYRARLELGCRSGQ